MADSPRLTPEVNLVLIGYRACGKTSVGAALARRLGRPCLDLDQVLVAEAGRSIAEIVAREGWPGFRRREKELVGRYAGKTGQVLAPGGGVILDPENIRSLQENGVIIWLQAQPDTIKERLSQDLGQQVNRPGLTEGDYLQEVERVLAAREPLYRQAADIEIDTTGLTVAQVADLVLAAVKHVERDIHGR